MEDTRMFDSQPDKQGVQCPKAGGGLHIVPRRKLIVQPYSDLSCSALEPRLLVEEGWIVLVLEALVSTAKAFGRSPKRI